MKKVIYILLILVSVYSIFTSHTLIDVQMLESGCGKKLERNPFLEKFVSQIKQFKSRRVGGFYYNAYELPCPKKFRLKNCKCWEFHYSSYLPREKDIIGKPRLKAFLTIRAARNRVNNVYLDQIVDTSEQIYSVTLESGSNELEESKIIGYTKANLEKVFQGYISKGDSIFYKSDDWDVIFLMHSDTVKKMIVQGR